MKYTELEKILLRFKNLANKLYLLSKEYPKISPQNKFGLQSLIREYIVLQLWSFLRARDDFLKELEKMNLKIFDESMKPMWEPLIENRTAITKLRNRHIAHVQEQKPFKEYIYDIIEKYQFAGSTGDILLLCRCVLNYIQFVKTKFKKEWESAGQKYNTLRPYPYSISITKITDLEEIMKRKKLEVQKNFQQNNI